MTESYQYLVESIRKFPNQEKFSEMIINEGFKKVKYKTLPLVLRRYILRGNFR